MKVLLYSLSLLAIVHSQVYTSINDFECLGVNKTTIYFQNNPTKVVPQPNPVRVMTCGYASQCALNMAAYIFMREKIGFNTSTYPGENFGDLVWWSNAWYDKPDFDWGAWHGNYWWWIANDDIDLNFEFWPGQASIGNATEYYASGSVIEGGLSGTYGEVGFWIPEYYANDNPTVILPDFLNSDSTYLADMMNGPKNGTVQERSLSTAALAKYQRRLADLTSCDVINSAGVYSTCNTGTAVGCLLFAYYTPTPIIRTTQCAMDVAGAIKTMDCSVYQEYSSGGNVTAILARLTGYLQYVNCTHSLTTLQGSSCAYINETTASYSSAYGILTSDNTTIVECTGVTNNAGTSCSSFTGTLDSYTWLGNTHKVANDTGSCTILDGSQETYTTGNYYEYFQTSIWGVTYNTNFDEPNGTVPVVWGSKDSYVQTTLAKALALNSLNGAYEVASTAQSEAELIPMIKDLYSRRMPFIANHYIPDEAFLGVDSVTNDSQKFSKVVFNRNSDQTFDASCLAAGTCQYPVDVLGKISNPKLSNDDRTPEAVKFFFQYSLPLSQMRIISGYYFEHQDGKTMADQKDSWLKASCDWLKDSRSEPVWSNWLVDVVRYDCLTGCGVQIEGRNGSDTVNDYYGGTCDYYTGTCTCLDDRLFNDNGRTCDESCPGLIGPYLDSTNSYTFDYCSGNGECDILGECECELGYAGDGCQREFTEYKFPLGLAVLFIILSSILVISLILCIVWLRSNTQYKTVKALSIDMTSLMSIGLIFLCLSNIFLCLKQTNGVCITWQFLFGLGGILSIMSPLLKAYRVSRVFHGGKMLRAVKITDKMLMGTLLKAGLLELVICVTYIVTHQLFGEKGSVVYYNLTEERIEQKCNDHDIPTYIKMGSFAYFGIVLCLLTYYSYGTRRALSVFKESTCAYFSSFLSLFCTLIVFVFNLAETDPTFQNSVFISAVIIVVTAVCILFYGTRIYTFYTEPENRNVTDVRASTANSKSFTSTASVMKPGPNSKA